MNKDRKDGKYVKIDEPLSAIMPYIFDKRTESEVYIKEELDVTKLMKWIEIKNKKLDYKITPFHALSSVFVKTVYNRPLLNRFVQGHRVYDRNDISFAFVAKNKKVDNSKDMIVIIKANPNENALELSRRMAVDIFKTKKSETNNLNIFINKFLNLPRCILRLVVKVFKWLDYHGWLPKNFTDTDSNYATILFSNLGSIRSSSCYHHLNNYGTNSIIITIGIIREENKRYIVDIGTTLDERIASGFYFVKTLKLVQYILDNPKILEEKLSSEIEIKED